MQIGIDRLRGNGTQIYRKRGTVRKRSDERLLPRGGGFVKEVLMMIHNKHKKDILTRILAAMMAVFLVLGMYKPAAKAADDPVDLTENLRVAELPGGEMQFVYSDAWFTVDSSEYNPHLATLSMLMADESAEKADAVAFLEAMDYSDIESNAYYDMADDRPNSASVLAGRKTIETEDGEATLIAVVINGYRYNLQWTGDFIIGDTGVHVGFQAARDEVLRFLKAYVTKLGISGETKFWLGGHSRGGGIANLVGAFLADDSYDYLPVDTGAEDVYAYTFATPATMVTGKLTKSEFGAVEANRTETGYESDTVMAAYTYDGADGSQILSPDDAVYSGVHNHRPAEDLITLLPPKSWDYTCFGSIAPDYTAFDQDEMLMYLSQFDTSLVDGFINYGGPGTYTWKTFDIQNMELIDDPTAADPITQAEMMQARMEGMRHMIGAQSDYVASGYQDAMSSMAGLIGSMPSDLANVVLADKAPLIKWGILTYISYVKQWYKAEKGKDLTDGEAGAIVLVEALEMITGEKIAPEDQTLDYALYLLTKYLVDNVEPIRDDSDNPDKITGYTYSTKLAETLFTALNTMIREKASFLGDTLYILLCACSYGSEADKGKEDVTQDTGKYARMGIYMFMSSIFPDYPDIATVVGMYGTCTLQELLTAALPIAYPQKDAEGNKLTFQSVEEAADYMIGDVFANALAKLTADAKAPTSGPVADYYQSFVQQIGANAAALRSALAGFLFYSPGDTFDIQEQIRTAATFISQATAIFYSHHPTIYAAWYLSADDFYPFVVSSEEEGDYEAPVELELSYPAGSQVYYTLDGTEPTAQSTPYTGIITLPQTDEKQEIQVKAIAVRNGYEGRVWTYDYTIEAPVSYQIVSGADSEWTEGSGESLTFTAKRSCNDEKTFGSFEGLDMDGTAVSDTAYEKKAGSLILTLPADYLETLSVGEHTLTMHFENQLTAVAKFTVIARKADDQGGKDDDSKSDTPGSGDPKKDADPSVTPSPADSNTKPNRANNAANANTKEKSAKTGDDMPILFLEIVLGLSLLGAGITLGMKKKKQ